MKYKDLFTYSKEHNIDDKLCSYLIDNHLFIPNIDKLENNIIDTTIEKKFKNAIKRLKKEPIQYIVGNVDFYGYIYKVTKNTLIPRFETEELIDYTISLIKEHMPENSKIIDVGTGTGCIGITLKKELPNMDVTLTDISSKALKVAKENAKGLDIKIIKSDILKNIKDKYDILISNPPYISKNEDIMDLVKNNEPKEALFAKNNGLYFYEEIIKNAYRILNDKFIIAFEIGRTQRDDIIKIINKYLGNIKIITKKDLQQNDRFIFIISE